MAHKIGAAYHIPHGLANALLICNVIRYNANDNPTKQTAFSQYDRPKARARYAEIADHLGLGGARTGDKVNNLIAWLEGLKKDLDIPASIQAAGVTEADFLAKLDEVAVAAFDDQCTGANPRFPLISELKQILLDSYYGRAYLEGYDQASSDDTDTTVVTLVRA
jgi:acetaldehyde dehydrogenase/alcohol dehydrogenase